MLSHQTCAGRARASDLTLPSCPPSPTVCRLPFTSAYVGSMALTLYAALVLHSYFLVLIFSLVQACAVAWYLLSYVPGGAPILKLVTRSTLRVMAALCCRGASSSGWGGGGSGSPPALLSWGSSRSNSMLPL